MSIARPAFVQAAPIHNPMKPLPEPKAGLCARTWCSWPRFCTLKTGHEGECALKLRFREYL